MSRDLNNLKPEFRALVDPFLADWNAQANGVELIVTDAFRSLADQAALYALGRTHPGRIVTRAKPGQSAHNYGLAIDVCPLRHGRPVWDSSDPVWQEIGAFGMARGLDWLGKPNSEFLEEPHFQLPNWREHLRLAPAVPVLTQKVAA